MSCILLRASSDAVVCNVRLSFQIIPQTMFSQLGKIIQLMTSQIKEVPTRLEKDKMKEFAQLEERYEVLLFMPPGRVILGLLFYDKRYSKRL